MENNSDFDNSDVTPVGSSEIVEPPVPPITVPPSVEEIPELNTTGRSKRKCPLCNKPGKGPRNGWHCEDHKSQYHASRGGERTSTPGPPPLSKEPPENLPDIELPAELGLAEMGAAFLIEDTKRQEAEGWPIRLGEPFIRGLWLPWAKYLETELLKSMAGKINKKEAAGIVVVTPFVNSAAFRVVKRFRKKPAKDVPVTPIKEAEVAEQKTAPVEPVAESPSVEEQPRQGNSRPPGNYSLS